MTVFVSGSSIGERCRASFDALMFNVIKVVAAGGIIVSVPGVLLGAMIPAEGLSRTETIEQNLIDDHARIWEWAGAGAEKFGQWMEEKG